MSTSTSTTSKQFSLNGKDLLRGLLVAILSPIFTILIESLNQGSLTFDWKAIAAVGLSAGLAYLLKNFLTPSTIVVSAPSDTVQSVKDGKQDVTINPK